MARAPPNGTLLLRPSCLELGKNQDQNNKSKKKILQTQIAQPPPPPRMLQKPQRPAEALTQMAAPPPRMQQKPQPRSGVAPTDFSSPSTVEAVAVEKAPASLLAKTATPLAATGASLAPS